MLEFTDIRFAYQGASRYALDGVSLTLAPGERIVLLGANGSGKSTLARLAGGMLLPSSGTVSADGILSTDAARLRELRTTVGIVMQDPESQIVSSTVTDEVAFGPENLALSRPQIAERVKDAIEAVGLSGKEHREPHTLSGGEKQRLVIAGILAMDPTYIVLDEPCSMLDVNGRLEVRAIVERLRSQGKGILHITHDLDECIGADRVAVLDEGHIVFTGTPDELIGNTDALLEHGLVLTPILSLAAKLRAGGVDIPSYVLSSSLLAHAVVIYVRAGGASCRS